MNDKPIHLVDRELSWLKFNARVLEEAARTEVPLCERLLFLRIFQTNLDEFYKVRVGTLVDQDDARAREQLAAIAVDVERLLVREASIYAALTTELKALKVKAVDVVAPADWTKDERAKAGKWFADHVTPYATAIAVGKRQTFPFLRDKETYLVADLEKRLGMLCCSTAGLPRLVTLASGRQALFEDVARAEAKQLFPGYEVKATALVRVTRNADLDPEAEYDDNEDYREFMDKLMKTRRRLAPVRLEATADSDAGLLKKLADQLNLRRGTVILSRPLDLAFVEAFRDRLRAFPSLYYPRHSPRHHAEFARGAVMSQIMKRDRLLAFPYDSMQPFLALLQEAATDPKTIAIRITLYRVAAQSQIVESLIAAAENGKEVEVVVELKARFDEENNIELSRRLEAAGCQVIYGLEGYKVHSKLCLITRLGANGPETITQVGTGNYNEKTSRLYTDFSLMTADHALAADAAQIFRALALGTLPEATQELLVAPRGLKPRILALIQEQAARAQRGEPAYIGLKLNGLTDRGIMDALVAASCAGVKIDLVVRGICRLVPGVKGATENIRVVSLVGRFLEHARLYIFGADEQAAIYISSADFMTRNTTRRIEVAAPVRSPRTRRTLRTMFKVMVADNRQAWEMQADGTYRRVPPTGAPVDAQTFFAEAIPRETRPTCRPPSRR